MWAQRAGAQLRQRARFTNTQQMWSAPPTPPPPRPPTPTPSHSRGRNYAGVLIVWDRAFGTFEEEDEAMPCIYGLDGRVSRVFCRRAWLSFQDLKVIFISGSAQFR